ncbi:MAG: zinc ABC transporter substrate-binding protein [Chlamydiia bacterium]|nr:zinc ABC transporter substrate-binding protein [Chlamydiia bacterium]
MTFTKRFLGIIVLCALVACQGPSLTEVEKRREEWFNPTGQLKVLTTIAMIQDLVAEIGGEYVDCISLITGQLDPHSYEMVKGDGEKLAFADIVFYSGLELEHGPSLKRYLEGSQKAVGIGDTIGHKMPDRILHMDGAIDPHIWMDVSLWAEGIDPIVASLAAADPAHGLEFRRNGEALKAKLAALHAEMIEILAAIPSAQRYLVTSHDAFNYFARAYLAEESERLDGSWTSRFEAPDGLAPDGQMSATDIQDIVTHLQRHHILVIFSESNVSRDAIRKVKEASSAVGLEIRIAEPALYGDAMGPYGTPEGTYIGMMRHNAHMIAQNLQ